jgi:Raf kinase inhibitor-like YbhB/YbcL family protein
MSLTLMSSAFTDGGPIPKKYARDGENLFPPLKWTGAPDKTKSFALLVEDPDAPGGLFRHAAIYNVPPDRTALEQSIDTAAQSGLRFGRNDFGGKAYDGPEPPVGHGMHHYHFRLAALDVPRIDLPAGTDAGEVWAEAEKHAIEEAEIVGTYERRA